MRTKNWIFALTIFAMFFAACEKSEKVVPALDKTAGRLVISTSEASIATEMMLVKEHAGLKALEEFQAFSGAVGVDLSVGKKSGLLSGKKSFAEVKSILSKKTEESILMAGTYTYDFMTEGFDFVDGVPNDKLVVKYPANGSTINNATLTIYKNSYDLGERAIKYELVFDIAIDGVVKLKSNQKMEMSEAGLISEQIIEINPYKIISRTNLTDPTVSILLQLLKSDVSLFKTETKMKMDAEFKPAGDIDYYLQSGAAYLKGTISSAAMNQTVPSRSMYNLTLYSYPGNAKIGDVYMTANDAFVVYADGTEESIKSFAYSAGEVMSNLLGSDDSFDFGND